MLLSARTVLLPAKAVFLVTGAGAGAGLSGTKESRASVGELVAETSGRVGARMRMDIDGLVGVGLRMGFVDAIGLPSFPALLRAGVASVDRCFDSKSSTSLAAGGIGVSSLTGESGVLRPGVCGR